MKMGPPRWLLHQVAPEHGSSTRPGRRPTPGAGPPTATASPASRAPRITSPAPLPSFPAPANHHPYTRLALGGRSPTISVLLVPSRTSASRTRELAYRTPSEAA